MQIYTDNDTDIRLTITTTKYARNIINQIEGTAKAWKDTLVVVKWTTIPTNIHRARTLVTMNIITTIVQYKEFTDIIDKYNTHL